MKSKRSHAACNPTAQSDLLSSMIKHGTSWPKDGSQGHYDLTSQKDAFNMLLSASYFQAVDYTLSTRQVLSKIISSIATEAEMVGASEVIDRDNEEAAIAISTAIDEIASDLVLNSIE